MPFYIFKSLNASSAVPVVLFACPTIYVAPFFRYKLTPMYHFIACLVIF